MREIAADIEVFEAREERDERAQTENSRIAGAQKGAQSAGAHLYVMQRDDGTIKIGRSRDPEARRRALEWASDRKLALVTVAEGLGGEELALKIALADHRLRGEWFSSTARCRARIAAFIGGDLEFPYIVLRRPALKRRTPKADEVAMERALARAVAEIRRQGMPLAARLREYQTWSDAQRAALSAKKRDRAA